MVQNLKPQSQQNSEPLYSLIWNQLKQFPKGLATGSQNPPMVSGPAAAALISASFGCFAMMVAHHFSDGDKSKAVEQFLWMLGNWIPGSKNPDPLWGNIGSYSGKETMLLLGWLVTWPILHILWKERQVRAKTIFFWMFVLLIAAAVMSWHPLFPYLPLT